MSSLRFASGAIAALLLILPPPASGQEIGVKAGVNFASLTPEEDEEPDISRRVGAVGGAWVRTPPTARFSFQVEGLFSEKGVKFESGGFGAEVALRYIEVPLLARAGFGASSSAVRGFVVGGVAPAFKVSARGKSTFDGQEQSTDIGDEISALDFGLVAGAGLEFGRVLVEARYTYGLPHINTDDNGDEDRIKNRVFGVMAGFRFR